MSQFYNKKIIEHDIKLRYDTVNLNVSEKGFSRIDTNLGVFLVCIDDVKPFANGYKIFLRIWNPYYAKFTGIKVSVEWGKEGPPLPKDSKGYDEWKKSCDEWEKSLKKKDITFVDTLDAGCWNRVEMIISPATKDELGHLKLSNMMIDKIEMYIKQS